MTFAAGIGEYVPDHDFGSHKEEIEQPRGFYRHIHINHGPELERSIEEVKRVISVNENIRHKYSTRFLAIKLLENDEDLKKIVEELPNGKEILAVRDREEARIAEVVNEESEQAITDAKYGFIAGALRETYVDNHRGYVAHYSNHRLNRYSPCMGLSHFLPFPLSDVRRHLCAGRLSYAGD
ncbi:hypothetical protein NIB75_15810 [Bacteroides uniformis]|nr:hypothetical protein [Bacteroides uniformis]